jgi:hypothetical protein
MFFTDLLLAIDDLRAGSMSVIILVDQPLPWVAPRDRRRGPTPSFAL